MHLQVSNHHLGTGTRKGAGDRFTNVLGTARNDGDMAIHAKVCKCIKVAHGFFLLIEIFVGWAPPTPNRCCEKDEFRLSNARE
jgi:hypothetical protein